MQGCSPLEIRQGAGGALESMLFPVSCPCCHLEEIKRAFAFHSCKTVNATLHVRYGSVTHAGTVIWQFMSKGMFSIIWRHKGAVWGNKRVCQRMKGVFLFGIFWCMIREKNRGEGVL